MRQLKHPTYIEIPMSGSYDDLRYPDANGVGDIIEGQKQLDAYFDAVEKDVNAPVPQALSDYLRLSADACPALERTRRECDKLADNIVEKRQSRIKRQINQMKI